ncbi:hypothetical protein [Altererythrobacter sp. ZODW24]|uniref:hypothetical protein n=1 Tax=Altererythrobacter sp. ZODW24 TaxID=2185142 RepID=UPI000DF81CED|nr:hypothetical protein [Altererythrobacter sp. ZODW24]
MKRIVAIASIAVLAACSPAAEAPVEEAVAEAPAEESMAGTYEVSTEEGSGTTTIDVDGNFTNTVDGEVTDTGTMARVDGKSCFTSSEEGAEARCWTDSEPAEDGSWVATSDEGETVTVRRVDEAAAEEAAM